jgi:hypothetical protein
LCDRPPPTPCSSSSRRAKPSTQRYGLPGPRGRPDPQNYRSPTLKSFKFLPKVLPRQTRRRSSECIAVSAVHPANRRLPGSPAGPYCLSSLIRSHASPVRELVNRLPLCTRAKLNPKQEDCHSSQFAGLARELRHTSTSPYQRAHQRALPPRQRRPSHKACHVRSKSLPRPWEAEKLRSKPLCRLRGGSTEVPNRSKAQPYLRSKFKKKWPAGISPNTSISFGNWQSGPPRSPAGRGDKEKLKSILKYRWAKGPFEIPVKPKR